MSGPEATTLELKLAHMSEMLKWLEQTLAEGLESYLRSPRTQHATERELQTLIEAATDINLHILTSSGHAPPQDYHQSFLALARDTEAISVGLALKLAPSAGLRNRLVHEYGDVDSARVFDSIQDALSLYPQYITEIREYIAGHPSEG